MDSTRRRRYAGLGDEEGAGPDFVEFEDVKPWYRRRPIQALMVFAAIALVLGIVLAIAIPGTPSPLPSLPSPVVPSSLHFFFILHLFSSTI
jgi:hypothetical protein